MALTFLPEEILDVIVEYFSIKELLACSAVSLQWRERFNADIFWKRFCVKELANYLEDTASLVIPIFELPKESEERLQPLCNWRINYMRQTHLINNWKCARFLSYEFRKYSGVKFSDVKTDCEGIHWLFLTTESEVEIWNINAHPEHFATVKIFPDCPLTDIFIVGKIVIITQWNIISVYDLQCRKESFKPFFKCLLEENELLSELYWQLTDKGTVDFINDTDDFRYVNFGNILVGYKRIPNPFLDLSMHIWDITSGKKMKIESMMHTLCDVLQIAFTNIFKIDNFKALIRMVYMDLERDMYSQLFVYDFKKKDFTNLDIVIPGVVVWCGSTQNIIVTFRSHPGTIQFFNYSSGKLLAVKEIGEYTNSEQMQLIDSYLLYCMFNCMNVLDIHKQEIVYCLEFSFYSFVRRLTVIEPRFVVVWLLERGRSPGCPSYYQEVWDIKNLSSKLCQYSSDDGYEMATNSSSLVKQVICYNNMMSLYTFW